MLSLSELGKGDVRPCWFRSARLMVSGAEDDVPAKAASKIMSEMAPSTLKATSKAILVCCLVTLKPSRGMNP